MIIDIDTYYEMYNKYIEQGINLEFSDYNDKYKLCEKSNDFLISKIDKIKKMGLTDYTGLRHAWVDIFTDVLNKRRIETINKLKQKINENKTNN